MTRPWSSPDRDAGDADAPTGPDDHVIDIEVEGEAARRLVDPTDDHADTAEPSRHRSSDWRRVAGIAVAIGFAVGVTAVVMILASDDVEAPTDPTPAPDDTVTATVPPVEEDEQDDQDDGDAAPTTPAGLTGDDPSAELLTALDGFPSLDVARRTTIKLDGAGGQRVRVVEYDPGERRMRLGHVIDVSADDPSIAWALVADADAGLFTRTGPDPDGPWERSDHRAGFDDLAREWLAGPIGSLVFDRELEARRRLLAIVDGVLTPLYVVVEDEGEHSGVAHRYHVGPHDEVVRAQIDRPGRPSTVLEFEILDEIDIPSPDVDHG